MTFDNPGEGNWQIAVFSPEVLEDPVDYTIEVEDVDNNLRHEFTGVIKELNRVENFGENNYEYCRPGVLWSCEEDNEAGNPAP
jgi:hypothetical protein